MFDLADVSVNIQPIPSVESEESDEAPGEEPEEQLEEQPVEKRLRSGAIIETVPVTRHKRQLTGQSNLAPNQATVPVKVLVISHSA